MRTVITAAAHRSASNAALVGAFLCTVLLCTVAAAFCYRWLEFPYSKQSEIIGWISVNRYSKAQELFWFSYFTVFVPALYFVLLTLWQRGVGAVGSFADADLDVVSPGSGSAELFSTRDWHNRSWSNEQALLLIRGARLLRGFCGYVLVPLMLYLLITAQSIDGIIDFFHEGETLAPAHESLSGGIPFRDIYVQHGLIKNIYLPRLGFLLFGETVEALRRVEAIGMGITAVALYALCLVLFGGRILLAGFLSFNLTCWQFWVQTRNLFPILFVLALCLWLRRRLQLQLPRGAQPSTGAATGAPWYLFIAGVCCACSFWFSVDVGIYTSVAAGCFLPLFHLLHPQDGARVRPLLRSLCTFAAGVLLIHLPLLLYLARYGALDAMWENVYVQCVYQLQVWGLPFPSVTQLASELRVTTAEPAIELWDRVVASQTFSFYLPPALYCVAGLYFVYRYFTRRLAYNETALQGLLLLIVSLLFFRTALGRASFGHIVNATTFFWLLCFLPLKCLLAAATWREEMRSGRAVATVQLASLLAASVLLGGYMVQKHQFLTAYAVRWRQLQQNWADVSVARLITAPPSVQADHAASLATKPKGVGTVQIPQSQADQITAVVDYIEKAAPRRPTASAKIFDFSNNGAYYFFARRQNPTRYHQLAYAATPEQQREVVQALERDETPLVLYQTGTGWDAPDQIPNQKRHWIIAEYLTKRYRESANFNGTVLLQRIESGFSAPP